MRLFCQYWLILLLYNSIAFANNSAIDASTCNQQNFASQSLPNEKSFTDVLNYTVLEMAWPCAKGVFSGAWAATGGRLSQLGDCAFSPFECADNARNALSRSFDFFADISNQVEKTFENISSLPLKAKAEMVCSLISSLGITVIASIFTSGLAAGKYAVELAAISTRITKLADIAKFNLSLNFKYITNMADEVLDKVAFYVRSGHKSLIEKLAKESCVL